MGATFGKGDKNATNDVLNGQVVATGTPGAVTVKDPNRGLTDEQVKNQRMLMAGGQSAKSIAQSFDQPDQSQAGPQVNFAQFGQSRKMPFYGDFGKY